MPQLSSEKLLAQALSSAQPQEKGITTRTTVLTPSITFPIVMPRKLMGFGREYYPMPEDDLPITRLENETVEVKEDGGRLLWVKNGGVVKAYMVHGDITDLETKENVIFRYPELKETSLPDGTMLDVETVVFRNGMSDFSGFLSRKGLKAPYDIDDASRENPATAFVIAVLWYDGKDYTGVSTKENLKLRREVVKRADNPHFAEMRTSDDAEDLFEETRKKKEEGIVIKRLDVPYSFGNSSYWAKIKHMMERDLIISGFTKKKRDMSSLILEQEGRYFLKVTINGEEWKDTVEEIKKRVGGLPLQGYSKSSSDGEVFWLKRNLIATVRTSIAGGGKRFPVLKMVREVGQ